MTAAEVQLSHSVELEILMNGKKTTLLSSVEQMIGTTALLTPIHLNGKVVGFPPDCTVNLLYIEEGHVYCWKNVKVKAVRYEKKIYHSVELIADAEMLNRRGAYRVFIGETMLLTAFTANGPKTYNVLLKDVSETGMAFYSKEEFDVGRTVRLHLALNKSQELQLSSQIIRIQDFEERPDKLYGCKFLERNDRLIGFLMRLQQDRQKQKLGV
ncbi:MAG: PilZ domain-containing protein [Lachnospiraceae bacterium]|nr:PilZ domain-containing protein [Lachnospiraceae bacterium]